MIDVIIPTVTGREETLARLLDSYERNTAPDVLTFIIIKDEETCGGAWKKGMALSTAPYLALACDDLEVASPTWAGACCEVVDRGELPCPIVRRPDGSIESCGGDMNAPACLISDMQPDGTVVDFTPVPFMSREQAGAISMLEIHYGSDVWVSHRGRQLGYETTVAHGYEFVHHHSNIKRRQPEPGEIATMTKALEAA